MKVLFFNRDHSQWIGGDAVQLENTMKALERLGVETEYSCDPNHETDEHDLVHAFHVNFPWSRTICERLTRKHKPYVISAIFFPHEYSMNFGEIRQFVDGSRHTICQSENEKSEMVSLTGCNPDKVVVIPNGVDKSIFKPAKGKKIDRVMTVGPLNPMKGGYLLAKACARLGLPLCVIGKDERNEYSYVLKKAATEHYEGLQPQEMAQMYQTSRVFVCPSLSDRQSIAVLEAAACGLPIVDSVNNRGHSLLPSSLVVDPTDTNQLCEAITKAWDMSENTDFVPSWDDVAKQVLKTYEE